jgi:hypothetical protein
MWSAGRGYFDFLSDESEQLCDEPDLTTKVVSLHPPNPPLAHHVYGFIALNGSSGGVKCPEPLLGVNRPFDRPMVLLNGLITNDKFCLSVVSSQKLGWVRGPRAGVGGRSEPASCPEGVRPPSGGEHATKVAGSTSRATEVGCGAAVGSSLPTSPGVDSRRGTKRRFLARVLTPTRGEDQ